MSGVPLFVTAPLIRRWHTRWGATDAEVAGPMPGDEIVPKVSFNATRAITIAAPPEGVWPWIVQAEFPRAQALAVLPTGFSVSDLEDRLGKGPVLPLGLSMLENQSRPTRRLAPRHLPVGIPPVLSRRPLGKSPPPQAATARPDAGGAPPTTGRRATSSRAYPCSPSSCRPA